MNKFEAKKLKKEIIEKLNEIAILLQDIEEEYPTVYDEDNEGSFQEKDNPNWYPENTFLLTCKNVAESLATGEVDDALDYYTSSY